MKTALLFSLLLAILGSSFAQNKPFPQHTPYTKGHIKPTIDSQESLDQQTASFYDAWKAKYVKQGCGEGIYYVSFGEEGNTMTVSEAMGYGMMITAYMAGHDEEAQQIFDGMLAWVRKFPSPASPKLMAWKQIKECKNDDETGPNTASDGDIDIAYALLLAHKQWGSEGKINYLAEAKAMIELIYSDDVNKEFSTIQLGNWAHSYAGEKYFYSTRTSDFIIDHFRAFQHYNQNEGWGKVVDTCQSLVYRMQANHAPKTGLLPDFILNVQKGGNPSTAHFLEGDHDGHYYYNACRDPWRLTTDYLLYGDERSKDAVERMNQWLVTSTKGNTNALSNGYQLDGTAVYDWHDDTYLGAFAVSAMADSSRQDWLNTLYGELKASKVEDGDYYSNTLKMLYMLTLSGNVWKPEDAGVQELNVLAQSNKALTISGQKLPAGTKAKVVVMNVQGEALKSQKISEEEETLIKISKLKKGTYYIALELDGKLTGQAYRFVR